MRNYLDFFKRAIVFVFAMVFALINGAFDTSISGMLVHICCLSKNNIDKRIALSKILWTKHI